MDAGAALADLLEISSYVEVAAIVDDEGTLLAAAPDGDDAGRLAAAAVELLREAGERLGDGRRTATHLEAALPGASLFVVREADRIAVARTRPRPPSALVVHDLEACLRA